MKYKDRNFQKVQDKQRNGEVGYCMNKSERKERREREHQLSKFYARNLSGLIDKDWWQCLKLSDKSRVMTSYQTQREMMLLDNQLIWSTHLTFDTWDGWRDHVLNEYKPDTAMLRQLRMKKLGI